MTVLTGHQKAEAVLAQLRGVGPQTVAEIQADLRLSKRDVERALWLLGSRGQVEYGWPTSSPLVYQAARPDSSS